MAKGRPRARRGIGKSEILEAASQLYAEGGDDTFSVRKVGQTLGVDPMTVLHHFQSKSELLRQIGDRALSTVKLPKPSGCWRLDLKNIAYAYRDLAHRHPRAFQLHFRFHATGPADHMSSEIAYKAMRDAGLPDPVAAGLGLSFYAFVMGFGLAEIDGLLRPIGEDDEAELMALDPDLCPATRALVPSFKNLNPDEAFETALTAFIEGVAVAGRVAEPSGGQHKIVPELNTISAVRR